MKKIYATWNNLIHDMEKYENDTQFYLWVDSCDKDIFT